MAILEPARIPITILRGVDFYFPMRLGNRQTGWYLGRDGEDLAQWRAAFRVYPDGDGPTPVVTLTTENGGIELAVRDGGPFGVYNCLLYLSAAATGALTPWGMGAYHLHIIDPMGHEQRVAAHTCVLE